MTTFDKIRQWGKDRALDDKSSLAQHNKLLEEAGELHSALMSNDEQEVVDAIGDCVVVLTILAMQQGLRIEHCIDAAYQEIKDRKGKLVNGVFVKQ